MRDDQNQAGAIVGPLTNGLPILVAVCTRDWNAFRQTENYRLVVQQLAEQRKKGRNIQLLIVDNSGVALSQKEQITPNFATLIYEPRIGIPFARNAALEWALRAGVEWMVFIDDDVQPVHDCWRAFLRTSASRMPTYCKA